MKRLAIAVALLLLGAVAASAQTLTLRNFMPASRGGVVRGVVQAPASSVNNAPACFDGTNGQLAKVCTTPINGTGLGAVPAGSITAGVTVSETGLGFIHQAVFTLTTVSVTMTDATTAGSHGSIQLYDFPAGLVLYLGTTSDLSVTAGAGGIGDTAAVVCAVGTVTLATDNATLTSTEADLIPSTAATLTGGVGACDGESTTALIAALDGTATAKDGWLNFAVPDADSSANDTLAVAGTVTLTWIQAGDN